MAKILMMSERRVIGLSHPLISWLSVSGNKSIWQGTGSF